MRLDTSAFHTEGGDEVDGGEEADANGFPEEITTGAPRARNQDTVGGAVGDTVVYRYCSRGVRAGVTIVGIRISSNLNPARNP